MSQSIGEIKALLQAADLKGLPAFIKTYKEDERAGVASLVEKAKKQLNAYEKELARTELLAEAKEV